MCRLSKTLNIDLKPEAVTNSMTQAFLAINNRFWKHSVNGVLAVLIFFSDSKEQRGAPKASNTEQVIFHAAV